MPASQDETAVAHQRRPLIFSTSYATRAPAGAGQNRQRWHDLWHHGDRVNEALILRSAQAFGDGQRLPMRLGSEEWGANVGYPDLD
jgi:hypothetical protein